MIAGVPFTGNLKLVKGNWTDWSTIQGVIFLGRLECNAPFSLIKHILRGVCSPRGRITQPRVWCISLLHLFSHYSVFSKATTGVLLRPTLLPAAMYHSSLRELPAPNRLRLTLPYLILTWKFLSFAHFLNTFFQYSVLFFVFSFSFLSCNS